MNYERYIFQMHDINSYMVKKLNLRESDDKITAKSFDELISKLKRRGYDCKDCYEGDEYLYLRKNGDPYQAEYYKKNDGTYELYLGNIHPTEEKNEGCCGKGCKSESVRTRRISRRLKEDSDEKDKYERFKDIIAGQSDKELIAYLERIAIQNYNQGFGQSEGMLKIIREELLKRMS